MSAQTESGVNVLIRRAMVSESSAIVFVLQQAFAEYEPFYTSAAFAATTPTSSQIRERWKEGPVWVAIKSDHIVGTVAAVPKRSGLYVRSMAVLPVVRGKGIARNLLKEIQSFAIKYRYPRLFLSTTPFLQPAIRLYEIFGFVRTDEGPDELHGTPLFTMEKSLDSKEE